jgi:PilZ domain
MLDERRQAARRDASCLAKIQLENGTSPLYCIVTDSSDGGIRVHSNGFHVPDEFALLLCGHGTAQHGTYRVIWRRDDEVGAKLIRGG